MASAFVSLFKVDGVPILPPVMTPEVRAEMTKYRQRAIELEVQLSQNRKQRQCAPETPETGPSQIPSSHRKGSFTLDAPSPGLTNLPSLVSPVRGSVTPLQGDDPVLDSSGGSPRPRLIRSNSYTLDSPSPLLMKHLRNENLNIKCSASMSEIPNTNVAKPHVKRLEFSMEPQPSAQKAAPKSGSDKPKWISTKKATLKAVTPVKKYKSPYESSSKFKPKTGKIANAKPTKQQNFVPSLDSKDTISAATPTTSINDCQQRIEVIKAEHKQRMVELMKRQEEEQNQLQESFRRQQEELMKMLATNSGTIDQIHTSTPLISSPIESSTEEDNEKPLLQSFRKSNISSKEFVHLNESQSSIENLSSSQTLQISSSYNSSKASAGFEDSDELFKTCENNTNDVNGNFHFEEMHRYIESIGQALEDKDLQQLSQLESTNKYHLGDQVAIRHHAASVINAHARGYLTRRLFQTERVQKVVQVIRDTLLFILDLHHEKIARQQVRSPADLQLKKTLLHQLTAACYQLHEIFFDITICQRMDIIRMDRENLRRKLEKRPLTASSVGSGKSTYSNTSAASSSRKQLNMRKLKMCSLYSVNIEGTTTTGKTDDESSRNHATPKHSGITATRPRTSSLSLRPSPGPPLHYFSYDVKPVPPTLSATVVSRLLKQMKNATGMPIVTAHCLEDDRPKTSSEAFVHLN